MQFSDKLDFLMRITNTSNKQLSQAISVDRSLVSLLRTGKRKQPKNLEHIRGMARFFALHADADFQRYAISEMLGQTALRSAMPADVLSDALQKWLIGDRDLVGHILDGMEPLPDPPGLFRNRTPSAQSGDTRFYYNNEGRREAMRDVSQLLSAQMTPCEILIASDGNMDWLFEDYEFSLTLQHHLIETLGRGYTIRQILPSMNFLNSYVETLKFWLPIYTTGQARVYYYPRLRDNLYRHSTIVIPGCAVQASSGIGLQSVSQITLCSSDPKLVDAYHAQFRDHLALCRPAMIVHRDMKDYPPCFTGFFAREGFTIQKTSPLSLTTMPIECLRLYYEQTQEAGWKDALQTFIDGIPVFEQHIRQSTYIDIAPLASAREVRAGLVPVSSAFMEVSPRPFYTPETYVMHLRSILRLMETYENYWFIPYHGEMQNDYNLFVSESGLALLVRLAPPALMLELRRPEMVQACKEHLLQLTDKEGYDGLRRLKICKEISALIRELQA